MQEPIFVVDHLTFRFPQRALFKDERFSIASGAFVGVIGPNGGGKTTLLRLLMGFLQPLKGTIRIRGEAPNPFRQNIAYVPQSWRVDRHFPISVLELVLLGRLHHLPWHGHFPREERNIAMEALERLGVASCAEQPFEQLSGGQVQRVLLARALAAEPDILFLDEPTANIDAKAERDIYSLLEELRNHVTILMVTHDLHTAIHHVDEVLCIQNGILPMTPDEVCKHYAVGLYHNPLLGERQ